MKTNVIIVDDFYSNPDGVREYALQQEFRDWGFPGSRCRSLLTEDTKNVIQKIIMPHAGRITNWNQQDGLTGSFELATASDRSWIHTDHYNTWAAVCYLTPDAPLSGGTGLFMYKKNGATTVAEMNGAKYETQDYTKWDLVDVIGNRYNRLAMYRSDIFHTSLDYFGSNKQDARLFQLFFITTEM